LCVSRPSNKAYISYDRKKPRKHQCDATPRYRKDRDCDYNNYFKRLLDNKLYNKGKEKDYVEYRSEHRPEHRFKYRSKNRERKL